MPSVNKFVGTIAEIKAVADAWGIPFRGGVDLWALNKAAEHRGAAPFAISQPPPLPRKSQLRCLCCNQWFYSENRKRNRLCEGCITAGCVPFRWGSKTQADR